jgi:hypothetical protein
MFLFFLYFSFAVIRNAAFSRVVAFWWVLASLLVGVVGRLMGTSLLLRFLRPMFLLLLRFGSSPSILFGVLGGLYAEQVHICF